VYSHSPEEEEKLKKIIHDKKYYTFHTSFVDEDGNPTDGNIRQIIFGSDELKKKSFNDIFTGKTMHFIDSMGHVKRLLDLYPIFYELYEKNKIEQYLSVLKIENVNQIDDVLEEAKDGVDIINPPETILGKLNCIAGFRQSKEEFELAKKTGEFRRYNVPMTNLDKLQFEGIQDRFNLFTEPEFLNEMILVYVVTIFNEYLKSNIEAIFTICPELKENSETRILVEQIPDTYDNILAIFKNNLKFDLKTQVPEWKLIEEKFLRRNLLIHANGIPNDDYNKKTNNVGDSRFNTDVNYIRDTLKIFEKARISINNYLWKHHVNPKFLEQMSSEETI